MTSKHDKVRVRLDNLGYFQALSLESVPLVDKLLGDLNITTESLQKYMKLAQNAIEERDNLQASAEPYKCDNAKLVRECNELYSAFLQYREQNEQMQSDLKRTIQTLKDENLEYKTDRDKLRKRIKELELELVGNRILNSKQPTSKSNPSNKSPKKKLPIEFNMAMALADHKTTSLSKEIQKIKEQNLQLVDNNQVLHNQIEARNREIKRLTGLLEGGRPLSAIRKDCFCNRSSSDTSAIQDQITRISKEKSMMETKLRDALTKQHEAMKHAMCLAERNKVLEKEMKEIDLLALSVEAQCNDKVKEGEEKVARLQIRIQKIIIDMQKLEKENQACREEKEGLMKMLEKVTLEKQHLQGILEKSLDEKKRLADKINTFTVIENDLNMEIDRLAGLAGEQRRKIAELESRIMSGRISISESPTLLPKTRDVHPKDQDDKIEIPFISKPNLKKSISPPKRKNYGSPVKSNNTRKSGLKKFSKSRSPQRSQPRHLAQNINNNPRTTPLLESAACRCCENCNSSSKHLKELLDKELDYHSQQAERCLDNLRAEKDFYMKEYHKILENMRGTNRVSMQTDDDENQSDLARKLLEKEEQIAVLQQENRVISQERYNLLSRLDGTDGHCLRAACKRTERERDILRADLERLGEERDDLKHRMTILTDSQVNESERLRKLLMESEERALKLEQERRQLVQNQGSGRANINALEEQCNLFRDQIRTVQSELNQQKTTYKKLKSLHEQTDRSLHDTQLKLVQTENELAAALETLKTKDLARGYADKEVDMLKKDILVMRGQLAALDREKDELLAMLDDKTEKLAQCEQMLKTKENTIAGLETAISDLKKRINLQLEENTDRDHLVRASQNELALLKQDLESTKRTRDAAILESRRLQEDLTVAMVDCKEARKELELYKRQVDDLKTQLQHYVAEVKRTEDLISNKEIERNELLDQFRSLSHDVNILENNNHTLENEASQSRVQLSVALGHAADLERHVENNETIIKSYEKQISDLTSQMASLEMQLKQFTTDFTRSDSEKKILRDLCEKLECENSKFRQQLRERDDERARIDRNVEKLKTDRELLQNSVTRDKRNVESMEKILDDAKHETNDLRSLNQELQEQVQSLKTQVLELKDRLVLTSEQLDMYQEKAIEYSQQNKQLRREIANERFRRTRESESSKCLCVCASNDKCFNPERDSIEGAVINPSNLTFGNPNAANDSMVPQAGSVIQSIFRTPYEESKSCYYSEYLRDVVKSPCKCKTPPNRTPMDQFFANNDFGSTGRSASTQSSKTYKSSRGIRSCFVVDGSTVKTCIAKYTVVHEPNVDKYKK